MANVEQSIVWNQTVGDAWVRHADDFDHTLAPFGEEVIRRLVPEPGERVLDIGCGAGATTLHLASLVAPALVVGLDLSTGMLALARARAADVADANVEFIEFDVQDAPTETRAFDVAFSRFGVMFFSDPERAFTNIRRSLTDSGRFGFVCFQGPFENPFILVPIMAAAAHLDLSPPPAPTAPSPFSLADPDRLSTLLHAAGFDSVGIDPGPTDAEIAGADDLRGLATRLLEQNPGIAPALAAAPNSARAAAVDAAAAALEPYVDGDRVVLGAATWVVTAA